VKLAYVTDYDSTDVDQASGLGWYIGRSLERADTVVTRVRLRAPPLLRLRSAARKAACTPRGRTYIGGLSRPRLEANARQIRATMRTQRFDVVVSPAIAPIAHLDCDRPIVLWSDTTMSGLIDFYPAFTGLAPQTVRDCFAADRAALDRCALAVFSSAWAADIAIRLHGADPCRVRVVPYGANIGHSPDDDAIHAMVRRRDARVCRLLFVGGDWERKGGPRALQILNALQAADVPAELTVIGPPVGAIGPLPPGVRWRGPLRKSTADGQRALADELARTHFLVLPTTADCCPVALAEANAFAVPSVTTNVAGIPSVVTDGVNGRMFDPATPAEVVAGDIAQTFCDRDRYERLALAAHGEYRSRLNWETAGARMLELLAPLGGRARR
jgi:glycosyltransferase involved in cell wall biosynthesis